MGFPCFGLRVKLNGLRRVAATTMAAAAAAAALGHFGNSKQWQGPTRKITTQVSSGAKFPNRAIARWPPSLAPNQCGFPIAMPPFRRWADLPPDLLCRIGDRLDLKCYAIARAACTAWRSALTPPSPALLVLSDARLCPSAASLPSRRSFDLAAILTGARVVGSSNGWLALSIDIAIYGGQSLFVLFNPVTSTEIILPPLIYESKWVSKVVFAPNPAKDYFAAAAICDIDRIAYVTAGARRWTVLDPLHIVAGDQLADVVYHDKGKVYCLTRCGDVLLLCLPERRHRKPIIDEPGPSEPEAPSPIAEWAHGLRARRGQYHQRNWRMICYEQLRSRDLTGPSKLTLCSEAFIPFRRISMGLLEPDLNAPATVEPLLDGNLLFDPATSFAPPYNTVSAFTNAKNIVLCEGVLYQIWRNASCTVTLQLPGGGHHRVSENEILVLRYYPRRQPCWNAVTDLGGYSVFVGRNNAVSIYAEGVPGLKGNCVYWIGGRGRDQGMVFDIETGRSTPCLPSAGGILGPLQSTICWYFLSDMVNSSNNSGGRRVYQTRARSRAERAQDTEE
ncbi:hypothetical protein GUJ93_ZPchr0004g39611 [Zizania palustris]|uniref:KIB1-4 beta-propeller domain-containing protein n=1 Tax=Zizania palustris TaxID=103762 RepID=A0A8J5V8S9_ZIZPA|nr:hypothetical protein GUJ93_ZPchr0004g39611 [Zizania palustris]